MALDVITPGTLQELLQHCRKESERGVFERDRALEVRGLRLLRSMGHVNAISHIFWTYEVRRVLPGLAQCIWASALTVYVPCR